MWKRDHSGSESRREAAGEEANVAFQSRRVLESAARRGAGHPALAPQPGL